MKFKVPAIFRRLTVEEARERIAESAENASLHHQLEALRLRYEIEQLIVQADGHDYQATVYARLALGHRSTT